MHRGAAPSGSGWPDPPAIASDLRGGTWARIRLTPAQWALLACLGVVIAAGVFLAPGATAIVAIAIAASLQIGHMAVRNIAWFAGIWPSAEPKLASDDDALPIYSIIVPMRHEANMARSLLRALGRLDYPKEKLDVIIALEHDDPETFEAMKRANPPPWCRVLVVPRAEVQTKPLASNVALAEAKGAFVVVYDAEDRPEPHQLREALATFQAHGDRLACVQARLAPYNRNANFLTRMFALDFCQWFDAMMRGLQRLGLPVPLGGTSNHFRIEVLRRAGAWDPFNVTEDADLGVRLWRLGWQTRMLNSTTWEEAPVRTLAWFRQRTRWIRGYMQTFFVHARSPRTLGLPPLGPSGWAFLVLFVGASWVFALVNPIFWALLGYSLAVGSSELDWAFGPIVGTLALFSLVVGNFLSVFVAFAGPVRRRWWGLQFWALFTPLYWIMISIVAYWALFTFFHNPFQWEKTPHGLDPRIERL